MALSAPGRATAAPEGGGGDCSEAVRSGFGGLAHLVHGRVLGGRRLGLHGRDVGPGGLGRRGVDLGRGAARATVWTCDFSHDYVSINADYRS